MLQTLKDVLPRAQAGGYAVGLFNTVNLEMLRGVIAAAEAERSPVIIGTAEILLPYGSLEELAGPLLARAKRASVPVVVHFDHGLTYEATVKALRLGFSSVMFDGSVYPYEENIAKTAEIVKLAHALGASVEAELGHVGNADGTSGGVYTDPAQALDFARRTGVDALAVAIGTAHGQYLTKPRLDLGRLGEIRQRVDTPLVLHGGSGLSADDFRNCIRAGIAKVNIFTDLTIAGLGAFRDGLKKETPSYLDMLAASEKAVAAATAEKMRIFGSTGKA